MSRKTVAHYMHKLVNHYKDKPSLIFKKPFRTQVWTYSQLYGYAQQIAGLFKEKKILKGDKIIIYSYNCPEWGAIFLACAVSGVIAVPLDFNSNKEFIKNIVKKTGAKLILSSKHKPISSKTEEIFVENILDASSNHKNYESKENIKEEDILEIVYTSGTTSEPKGVMITNKNLVSNIRSLRHVLPLKKSYIFLSFIPLSHLLEQTVGFFNPLRFGCKIVYTGSRKSSILKQAMQEEKITSIIGVPILLTTLKDKILREIEKQGNLKTFEKMFSLTSSLPISLRRLFFNKIINSLSSKLQFFVVGGAPLDEETENFWNGIGIRVLQGYGLTETSPIMTCNTFNNHKKGTVGMVLPDQEIKINSHGEILCKGENITNGYYKNKKATLQSIKKNWFHTGDIGSIDDDGHLTIKGRLKNMILTSSGLNVYPEDIEAVLNEHASVNDSVVLGLKEKKDIVITGIVLLNSRSKTNSTKLLKEINVKLSSHQQVQEIIIWSQKDFPRTPSLKIKRKEVVKYLKKNKTKNSLGKTSSNKLFEILAKLSNISLSKMSVRSVLSTDLAIDSLHRVELLSIIEEEYGVEIQENKITATTRVSDILKLINNSSVNKQTSNILSSIYTSYCVKFLRTFLQGITFVLLRLIYRVNVTGLDNLKKTNIPVIYVMNHTSHFDTPTLLRALPFNLKNNVAFAAAQDYFFAQEENKCSFWKQIKVTFLQIIFGIYPFSRGGDIKKSLKLTGQLLDNGVSVAIYPEGTRTLTTGMGSFKPGIGLIATNMAVAIIPVYLDGLYKILPKGKSIPSFGTVNVSFGKPLVFGETDLPFVVSKKIEDAVRELSNSK